MNFRSLYPNVNTDKNLVFIFIGRMVKDKGIVELVEAFTELNSETESIKLLLVGPYEPNLDPLPDSIVNTIETHKDIHHFGYQQDVRPYISASDVLVFPSYREGFPNVPMQCAAFSKALILSDINGCNEIVTDEETGLLVPVKDANAVYLAMKRLMQDKNLRISFGEKALNHIKDNFAQEEVWNAIKQEYLLQLSRLS